MEPKLLMHFDCNLVLFNYSLHYVFYSLNTGLSLTIVTPAAAAVVAGEEGIGEVRALIAGPGTS